MRKRNNNEKVQQQTKRREKISKHGSMGGIFICGRTGRTRSEARLGQPITGRGLELERLAVRTSDGIDHRVEVHVARKSHLVEGSKWKADTSADLADDASLQHRSKGRREGLAEERTAVTSSGEARKFTGNKQQGQDEIQNQCQFRAPVVSS